MMAHELTHKKATIHLVDVKPHLEAQKPYAITEDEIFDAYEDHCEQVRLFWKSEMKWHTCWIHHTHCLLEYLIIDKFTQFWKTVKFQMNKVTESSTEKSHLTVERFQERMDLSDEWAS